MPRVTADDVLRPGTEEARRWAREELAKPAYQKSFVERFFAWLWDQISGWFALGGAPGGTTPLPTVFAVMAVIVIVALVAFLVVRARRAGVARPAREAEEPVFVERLRAAEEYRRRAGRALAAGDARTAMIEGFRAVAAQLIERHVLDEARDRTAGEFAAAAAGAFPGEAPAAARAARAFDEAQYGGIDPGLDAAREVLALDGALAALSPREVDPASLPRPLAVPR